MAKDSTPSNPPARQTKPEQSAGTVFTPPADGSPVDPAKVPDNPPARDAFGGAPPPARSK